MKRKMLRRYDNESQALRDLKVQSPKAYSLLMRTKDRYSEKYPNLKFSFLDLNLKECYEKARVLIKQALPPLVKETFYFRGDREKPFTYTPGAWSVDYLGLRGSILYCVIYAHPSDVKYSFRAEVEPVLINALHQIGEKFPRVNNKRIVNNRLYMPAFQVDSSVTDNAIFQVVNMNLEVFFST